MSCGIEYCISVHNYALSYVGIKFHLVFCSHYYTSLCVRFVLFRAFSRWYTYFYLYRFFNVFVYFFFFSKQKTAYELRISDWSSDVCSSDLSGGLSSSATMPNGEPFAMDSSSTNTVIGHSRPFA